MLKSSLFLLFTLYCCNNASGRTWDAEILELNTQCTVRNGRLTTERSYRVKINNGGGDYFSKINIYYRKKEPVTIEEAWIENKYGQKVRKLTNKEITTRSDISASTLYEDSYVHSFILNHTDYPYIIYYKYKQSSDEFFRIIDWSPVYDQRIPTLSANLVVNLPVDYEVNIFENKIQACGSDSVEDRRILKWSCDFSDPDATEIYSPHFFDRFPFVSISPVRFKYENQGSYRDWKSFGNWVYSLLDGTQDLSGSDAEKIQKLLINCQNDDEKVRKLYHFLQDNTRYINVSISTGGWKPFPASYVAVRKYGDCKALSNYMISLLKAAGIRSYYTIIYAGEKYPHTDTLRLEHPVNHALVCVPLLNDTVWLECTNNVSPYGYLGTFTQNRHAFLIENDHSRFVLTPPLNEHDVKNSGNLKFVINDSPNVRGSFTFRLRGKRYEDIMGIKTYLPKEDQEKFIYENIGLSDLNIRNWEIISLHRDSAYADLQLDMDLLNFVRSIGNMKVIHQVPMPIPEFEPAGKREHAVIIPYPIYVTDTAEYIFQNNPVSVSIPGDTLIESNYGRYRRSTYIDSKTHLFIYKSFNLVSSSYNREEYPGFYSFINTITNEEKQIITLKK